MFRLPLPLLDPVVPAPLATPLTRFSVDVTEPVKVEAESPPSPEAAGVPLPVFCAIAALADTPKFEFPGAVLPVADCPGVTLNVRGRPVPGEVVVWVVPVLADTTTFAFPGVALLLLLAAFCPRARLTRPAPEELVRVVPALAVSTVFPGVPLLLAAGATFTTGTPATGEVIWVVPALMEIPDGVLPVAV
jgi:hypothetical protein